MFGHCLAPRRVPKTGEKNLRASTLVPQQDPGERLVTNWEYNSSVNYTHESYGCNGVNIVVVLD